MKAPERGKSVQPDLRADFHAAFIFPFAEYAWRSERARSFWIDLEYWIDALAGPLDSVIARGNCAYVYKRNDGYFSGVKDPSALRARLQDWHQNLIVGLDQFGPTSEPEAIDLATMRGFADGMWVVAERAIEIESARLAASASHYLRNLVRR